MLPSSKPLRECRWDLRDASKCSRSVSLIVRASVVALVLYILLPVSELYLHMLCMLRSRVCVIFVDRVCTVALGNVDSVECNASDVTCITGRSIMMLLCIGLQGALWEFSGGCNASQGVLEGWRVSCGTFSSQSLRVANCIEPDREVAG